MRHATVGVIPAFCAALAASIAPAQSPPAAGHSTASSPLSVNLDQTDGSTERPATPPRVAQYPLENDVYENPPRFPSDPPQPQRSYQQPAAPPLVEDEETAWISWDETRLNGGILHDSPEGLGIADVVFTGITKTAIPGVTINPQFGAHFFGSSSIPNIPDQTYDASIELTGGIPLGDDWILAGGISPGIFSDFEGSGGDLFRIPFRVLAFYKYSETLKLGAGVLYLDRPDVNILPLVGLSYIPNDHFNAELWFPRPKVSWRYMNRGDIQRWFYIVGEFGGGAWNIQNDNGTHDQFAYRDYRAMAGIEQKAPSGFAWFIEGGLIFNREVSFERADTTTELDNTAAMQMGLRF